MKPYEIDNGAFEDLESATFWYETQREGLGLELVEEFRQRLVQALEVPGLGAPVGNTPGGAEVRRFRLRRFKRYSILIASIEDVPTVLAFEHSSRRPGYWHDRLKQDDTESGEQD